MGVDAGKQPGDGSVDLSQQGLDTRGRDKIVPGAGYARRGTLETRDGAIEEGELLGDLGQEAVQSLAVGAGNGCLCEFGGSVRGFSLMKVWVWERRHTDCLDDLDSLANKSGEDVEVGQLREVWKPVDEGKQPVQQTAVRDLDITSHGHVDDGSHGFGLDNGGGHGAGHQASHDGDHGGPHGDGLKGLDGL